MKQSFIFVNIIVITLAIVISVHAQQTDSLKMPQDIVVSSQGDTLIVINSVGSHTDEGMRNVNIDREIVITADGDTTIVRTVESSPPMWVRRNRKRDQIHKHDRNRVREHRKMHRGRRSAHGRSSESGYLRHMEAQARNLAREALQAKEDSYLEKERILQEHLEEIFDFKQEMESEELSQQQRDLEMQILTLEKRQKNREVIINDRLNQLLGRGSSYNW